MIELLLYRLDLLTRRERLLLAALVGIVLPLALGGFVVLPLREARQQAVARAAEADALHRWVVSRAADLPADALRPQSRPIDDSGPIGISRLEQTLVTAGLRQRIVRLAKKPQGGVEIGFDPVPFEQLTGWLQSVSNIWGYSISELRIERSETPGNVTAEFMLEPRQ